MIKRLVVVLGATFGVLGILTVPLAPIAYAEGSASTVVADASLSSDGLLKVTETVTFSGQVPAQLRQKFETRQDMVGDRQYVRELSQITATVKGAPVPLEVDADSRFTTVTVPTGGAPEVTIGYTVRGAVVAIDGNQTALRWPLLQGLSTSVADFSATVRIPAAFSYVKCTAGPPNSTVPCTTAAAGTDASPIPTFRDGPRGEGESVAIDIGFPEGAIAATEQITHRWTVARAFSAGPLQLAVALGIVLLGGLALFLAHRRTGLDLSTGGQFVRPAEFVPTAPGQSEFQVVGEVRPGHVGTVADERVDPIDVTASLVDLAVRGHLRITELPLTSSFARSDWSVTRLDAAADDLRPFEAVLLDGIAPVGGEVRVSELASRVYEAIGGIQDALYDEVVAKGWYERRPDAIRSRWTLLGLGALILAVSAAGVLAAFTTFGLVGLALIIVALGCVFVGQEMPARSAKGAALLGGLGALRSDLLSHPTDQLKPGTEFGEISRLLPYAIVLGGTDRWLDALAAADTDETPDSADLSWYHGPEGWHLRDFPDSMKNFVTMASGSLFAR